MDGIELLRQSVLSMKNSYSPYSGFKVGAAVLSGSGKIYLGANIENASYGATCCAERVAVFNAISSGERIIKAIAISSDCTDYIMPCGICRQVLAEFGDDDMIIYCGSSDGGYKVYKLNELFPGPFRFFPK